MKKFVSIMIAALLAMSLFAGCATNEDSSGTDEASQQPAGSDEAEGSFDADNEIMVVSPRRWLWDKRRFCGAAWNRAGG